MGISQEAVADPAALTPFDHHLVTRGTHLELHRKLGAHEGEERGRTGVWFSVWAPDARAVSVVGDFNDWDARRDPLRPNGSGVWETFVEGARAGALYKFRVVAESGEILPLKADPLARLQELPPRSASVVAARSRYAWSDAEWMAARISDMRRKPMSIYEVHLGSWARKENNQFLTYRELADRLIPYAAEMGFTHIELMPIGEHPFYGSWGYQPLGLFAPSRRYGEPDDLRYLIDRAHRAGIGVILDWVVSHFPEDGHGLGRFDGTALYEHADPRQGRQTEWNTLIYNYGRTEVANFLLCNALAWLEDYHIDGLRADAVASILYLDYAKKAGEWIPNAHGGRENLEAVNFLRRLNEVIYERVPGAFTIAEESTAWPMVSRPTYLGGLGFGFKWNMGWMNDTLRYIKHDPIHRKYHHDDLTFGLIYAFHENFILPLSHDEVVYGKGSMLAKMPGDTWQKFANLRCYLSFFFTHPGKKLMFMGAEIAQWNEWNHEQSLDWHLVERPAHKGMQALVRDLNHLYAREPALYERDCEDEGFSWIAAHDHENSVVSYVRRGADPQDFVVVVCNFTPVVRRGYRLGVPRAGRYSEIFNSDSAYYGGSDAGNGGEVIAGPDHSLELTLPPLGALILKPR
jgi:1,4-alpha-glucan branching enzyme